ncbi:hypothetical protein [Winogradskyella luteola]|uniref:Secreted protein n=1 Tax=Winogradskyella luteola TaxID=2828330 RepID=A0A9X1FBH5_9FLAO|nr:hypothetical protein [Winogradskyella luteola]MBV7270073.1 hypothetical protein [Winogradskyella luteola]
MSKKIVVVISFMLLGLYGIAQKSINNYKYLVVPIEYKFLKSQDQHRLNTLTRHLFKAEGFNVLFDVEDFPEELMLDRCKGLFVDVKKVKGGFLSTNLDIVLKDCFGKEVYRSTTGSSKEKDFKQAYTEALKQAFRSVEELDYKYEPMEEQAEDAKSQPKNDVVVIKAVEKAQPNQETSTEQKLSAEQEDYNDLYYAQAIENGYQLVNSEPKIVMILLNTAANNVYLVKGKSAIVYKEDGFWFYSENDGKLKEKQTLDIKF